MFLWSHEIEEEVVNMIVERHQKLTGMLVDVMRTMALDISNGPVLSAPDRHLWDDSFMAHMFEMDELQLRIGGHPFTDNEMETWHSVIP